MTLTEFFLKIASSNPFPAGEAGDDDRKRLLAMWSKHHASTSPTPTGFALWLTMKAMDMNQRIKRLEAKLAAVEKQQQASRFRGVYQPAESYEKHNMVSHDGALWVAVTDNPGRPGTAARDWQLCAKSGDLRERR